MNTRLAIIRSEGKEHLCYREEECFVDVSLSDGDIYQRGG